jgi:DNA-binding transcriptional LysR family regulator
MTKLGNQLGQISDIDLRLLKVFCSVVENGGVSAAEVSLGVSRSTIGTHLKELETRLGYVVCQRGRSGFRLTSKGKEIYEITRAFLGELAKFRKQVNNIEDAISGQLTVATVDNIIWEDSDVLKKTFADFASAGSKVELTVRILSPDEIEKALMEQKIDIGILTALHILPSLSYERLFGEINLLYCGSMHPLFETPNEEVSDEILRQAPYVNKGYIVTEFLEEANRRMDVRATAYDVESIALLILSGEYIGFLPESYAAYWCNRGEMRAILPDRYATSFDVMAATSKGAHKSAALDTFLELLNKNKT